MDNTNKNHMYETDVTYLEDKIVSATFSWLALNLDAPWNDAPDKPGKSTALGKYTSSLFGMGKVFNLYTKQITFHSNVHLVLYR